MGEHHHRQEEEKRRRSQGFDVEVKGGGGILVLGCVLVAAAVGGAFAARRARSNCKRSGGRKSPAIDRGGAAEVGQGEEGDGGERKGIHSLLNGRQGEFSVDTSEEVQEIAYESSELVLEAGESELEDDIRDLVDPVRGCPSGGINIGMPQGEIKQKLEEPEVSHCQQVVEVEEEGAPMGFQGEERQLPGQEEGGEEELESEGTTDSSVGSGAVAVWPSELIEQESGSLSVELNEIERQSKDIIAIDDEVGKPQVEGDRIGLQILIPLLEQIEQREEEVYVNGLTGVQDNTSCKTSDIVMETRESLLESGVGNVIGLVEEFSVGDINFDMTQHPMPNPVRSEVANSKLEEAADPKVVCQEEDSELYIEEEVGMREKVSEVTLDSSVSTEARWLTEAIEQENKSQFFETKEIIYQLDVPVELSDLVDIEQVEGDGNARPLPMIEHIESRQGDFSDDTSILVQENSCSNLETVMEIGDRQLESDSDGGLDSSVDQDLSLNFGGIDIPRYQMHQHSEGLKINHVKEEGLLKEPSNVKESEGQEEISIGTLACFAKSYAETVYPEEVFEQEKEFPFPTINEREHHILESITGATATATATQVEGGGNVMTEPQILLPASELIDHQQGDFCDDTSILVQENSCRNLETVMEIGDRQLESDSDGGVDNSVDQDFSLNFGGIDMPQYQIHQHSEGLKIDHVKEGLLKEPSDVKESEGQEEISIGTLACFAESHAETFYPEEVFEQEKEFPLPTINEREHHTLESITGATAAATQVELDGDVMTEPQILLPANELTDHQQGEYNDDSSIVAEENTGKNCTIPMESWEQQNTAESNEMTEEEPRESRNAHRNVEEVMEIREGLLDAKIDGMDSVTPELASNAIEFNLPEFSNNQHIEGTKNSHVEEEEVEEGLSMVPSEKEREPFAVEDMETTSATPMESSVEPILLTEENEREKGSIEIGDMKHQPAISEMAEDMVNEVEAGQGKENYKQEVQKKEETVAVATRRGKGLDFIPMDSSRDFILLTLALALACAVVVFAHGGHLWCHHHHHLTDVYNRLRQASSSFLPARKQ